MSHSELLPRQEGPSRVRDHFGRYLYWSDRKIRAMAQDNGVALGKAWYPTAVKTPGSIAGMPLPQIEYAHVSRQDQNRREIAKRVTKAVGKQAVVTFGSPLPALFAQGVGHVNFARYVGGPDQDDGALLHVRTSSTSGERVDLVLFGSMDNLADFRRSDALDTGWYSSAWLAVYELLETHGTQNTSQWDDPEDLSVEVLKIALDQGITREVDHVGRPWTRGYTLGHASECEWFAVIYSDVVLTPGRWNFPDGDSTRGASRILIGAPVWVRTASPRSVVRYGQVRRNAARAQSRWRRLLPRRPRPTLPL
ncbi:MULTISPECIES: hypothetical protein [unclassified Streptomyces]|uniref:hypothetical protein n=1 Tax=unclassified Streptomyces TaxID=2593676 RepID=UPI003405FB45